LRGVESKKVWLLGRFQAPGVYPMTNSITLLEAIFLAGGPLVSAQSTANVRDELADLRRSFLLRDGKMLPLDFERLFKGDLSQNVYLESEDFVYLAPTTVDEVHVIGAVIGPRVLPYTRGMSLVTAIAACSGTYHDAYLRQVAIVRGTLNQPKIALVNFKEIRTGKATDVLLEPGDIVYVPVKPYRILTRYADLIMSTFVSSVAINEGARAALRSPPPTTGILIPFGSSITVTPASH
jgi:protein involved in polysaccharide export with SLBB domain